MNERELDLAKFWSRVDIPRGPGWQRKCWTWKGAITSDRPANKSGGWGGGYGCLVTRGRWIRAHRYIWKLLHGDIPVGRVIGHSCDNRKCVNPHHLSLVSLSENLQEAYERGRRETTF